MVATLVKTWDTVGNELLLPDWHPRVIVQRHNDELARRNRWEKVRAFSRHDLKRWDLPTDPAATEDDRIRRIILSVPPHRASPTYFVYNSALATTAAPVAQPTGTAIRTMLQLRTATAVWARVIAWGCSFDASAAATPGKVELFENTAAATMSTAFAAADIQPSSPYNGTANTAGSSGTPFNLSTITSGFATAAVTEGTVAGYRGADLLLAPPTNPYVLQWPLGREFELTPQNYLRVRVTFGTSVNMYVWLLIET